MMQRYFHWLSGCVILLTAFAPRTWAAEITPPVRVQDVLASTMQVATGDNFTCVLTHDKSVYCWGVNYDGQLGNGSRFNQLSPVKVNGLENKVVAITAGRAHVCVILVNSSMACWGNNQYGQLGDGSFDNRTVPVLVKQLNDGVSLIGAGGYQTCAKTKTGQLACWGANNYGQVGNATTINQALPVNVVNLTAQVTAFATGHVHTCAVLADGGLMCWGDNTHGQLGNGTTNAENKPIATSGGGLKYSQIAVGDNHSCALTTDGFVYCWGRNGDGELGDEAGQAKLTPNKVAGLQEIKQLGARARNTCAIAKTNGIQCWGNNSAGQLGDGTLAPRAIPTQVIGLDSEVQTFAVGYYHMCAIKSNGALLCWGSNSNGQLGTEVIGNKYAPVDVKNIDGDIKAVSSGGRHSCVLMTLGAVKCWGDNASGQLGDNTTVNKAIPVTVFSLTEFSALSSGNDHTCAITQAGAAMCWGNNASGQLGDDSTSNRSSPTQVKGLAQKVVDIAAGDQFTCASLQDSSVQCWGRNVFGELGDGTTTSKSAPVVVAGLKVISGTLSAGNRHMCVITINNGAMCWGNNEKGQLGDGSTINQSAPVKVKGLDNQVKHVTAGNNHSCAIVANGAAKCWGDNAEGGLGDGTTINQLAPVQVSGLDSGVSKITIGDGHTCAITQNNILKCWGWNAFGQLGNNTTLSRSGPTPVENLGRNVLDVSGGGWHTCALTQSNTLMCWGDNSLGQLGVTGAWFVIPQNVNGFAGVQPLAEPNAKWLYMIYLAGDNDIKMQSAMKSAISNLEKYAKNAANANPNLVIAVQYDGVLNGDSKRYVFKPGQSQAISEMGMGELNMADPQTLKEFIAWARSQAPAPNAYTYLAIADHGRATDGMAWDYAGQENSNPKFADRLTVTELYDALSAATENGAKKIDILHFDVCLMSMIEVAYEIKDTAKVMIASQNPLWTVFTYDSYAKLVLNSGETPLQIAEKIALRYHTNAQMRDNARTLSVLNLDKIGPVITAMNQFADALSDVKEAYGLEIRNARYSVQKFDSARNREKNAYGTIGDEDSYIDLTDFALQIKQQVIGVKPVQSAAEQLVGLLIPSDTGFIYRNFVKSGKGYCNDEPQNLDRASGMGIYFPYSEAADDYKTYASQFKLSTQGRWDEFLNTYFSFGLGPPSGNQTSNSGVPPFCGYDTDDPANGSGRVVYLPLIILP
ncbi:MAG: clostripain-related cysteine peptidase [Anaerolineae bacterium]|nr:clostripain-related cysteine peptidase [Anaerolineae bacterium]